MKGIIRRINEHLQSKYNCNLYRSGKEEKIWALTELYKTKESFKKAATRLSNWCHKNGICFSDYAAVFVLRNM